MNQTLNELADALSKAQAEMKPALKDASNPFFKSKYATLESCWDAIRGPLTKNGLSIVQTTDLVDGRLVIRTTLLHKSGQSISGVYPIFAKDESPQSMGSGMSYARRYALSALVGLTTDDDDAEAAQPRAPQTSRATVTTQPQRPAAPSARIMIPARQTSSAPIG